MSGVPKDVRELVRFASDAMNAHQRGLSIPTVALHYRFEPGQAEAFLRRAIQEYGPGNVPSSLYPLHLLSLLATCRNSRHRHLYHAKSSEA